MNRVLNKRLDFFGGCGAALGEIADRALPEFLFELITWWAKKLNRHATRSKEFFGGKVLADREI
jgi:hypothetical protein